MNTRELSQILLNIPSIGNERTKKIIGHYGKDRDLLFLINHLYPSLNVDDCTLREAEGKARVQSHKAESGHISILSYKDHFYPQSLLFINDFPSLIYVRGNLELLNRPKRAALIGSRTASVSVLKETALVGRILVQCGYIIISGLAAGCDRAAHLSAVKEKSHTIAVMPCGPDMVYPRENLSLYHQITALKGSIVSEYGPGVPPETFRFVRRDRLQSGLAQFVVLMESRINGGAMYAALSALQQNRPLLVYSPPSFDESSAGNQYLINHKKVHTFKDPEEFAGLMKNIHKIISDCNRESDQLIFPYV
ncbi:MAG: DNA-protecting protein DprA [Spirochaetaceae bacterium]|nr:DNA-protecting protein DprA [Spirochaetaceae bacterium]